MAAWSFMARQDSELVEVVNYLQLRLLSCTMTMEAHGHRGAALRMPGPPLGNSDPAVEAWALMVRLMMSTKQRMAAIAQEFELAPMQMHALLALQPGEELPISALAGTLLCDA